MKFVRYIGDSDARELSAADFQTLGVEDSTTSLAIAKHEITAIGDREAEVLTIFLEKEFELISDEEMDEILGEPEAEEL